VSYLEVQITHQPRHGPAAIFACLLIGQPTLRRRLKLGPLAALDQRPIVRRRRTAVA